MGTGRASGVHPDAPRQDLRFARRDGEGERPASPMSVPPPTPPEPGLPAARESRFAALEGEITLLRAAVEQLEDGLGLNEGGFDRADILRRLDHVQSELAAGRLPAEELQELQLLMKAVEGELTRQKFAQTATMMEQWHRRLPQDLSTSTYPAQLNELVANWRAGMREKILSQVPIALRRKLEAGEEPERS